MGERAQVLEPEITTLPESPTKSQPKKLSRRLRQKLREEECETAAASSHMVPALPTPLTDMPPVLDPMAEFIRITDLLALPRFKTLALPASSVASELVAHEQQLNSGFGVDEHGMDPSEIRLSAELAHTQQELASEKAQTQLYVAQLAAAEVRIQNTSAELDSLVSQQDVSDTALAQLKLELMQAHDKFAKQDSKLKNAAKQHAEAKTLELTTRHLEKAEYEAGYFERQCALVKKTALEKQKLETLQLQKANESAIFHEKACQMNLQLREAQSVKIDKLTQRLSELHDMTTHTD